MKLAAAFAIFAAAASAQDAAMLLAKARAAFLENRERERFWTWNTEVKRLVVGKNGEVLQVIPSVVIESPIRSDGKRCQAVLAWSDGVAPYLADAPADERCSVPAEIPDMLKLEELLRSRHVKVKSRSANGITLVISEDKALANSANLIQRCAASVRATLLLDPATFFPTHIDIDVPTHDCERTVESAANHYDDVQLRKVIAGPFKDTKLEFDYELQQDRAGDSQKDFWIATHRIHARTVHGGALALLVLGRRFVVKAGPERSLVAESITAAAELSTESQIKFETEKIP